MRSRDYRSHEVSRFDWRWRLIAAIGLLMSTVAASADGEPRQSSPPTERRAEAGWSPLAFLIGDWTGEEEGRAGRGRGTRTYEPILDDVFLHARNRSVFEPQERNPDGETHQDWQIYSYDKEIERIVLRQFHSEGYVHRYVHDPEDEEGDWVFVSQEIENAPGMRAKLVLRRLDDDAFEEIFYLAFPGGDLTEFLRNRWRRAP